MKNSYSGTGKTFLYYYFNESTYNVETDHCSVNPDPGLLFKCPPTSLLCISSGTRMAKGLGQWEYANGQSFFAIFFLFQIGPLALIL